MVKYTRALTFENFSQRIIHLSKMYERRELRQMTSVDTDGLDPALLDKRAHSGGWQAWERLMERLFLKSRDVSSADEVREPIRSIDQLYLQAKTMVPYLSRLVQIWADQSDGILRVERTVQEAGAPAAAGGAGNDAYEVTHNAHKEAEGGRFSSSVPSTSPPPTSPPPSPHAPRPSPPSSQHASPPSRENERGRDGARETGDVADSERSGSSMCTDTDSNTASAGQVRGPSQLPNQTFLEEERAMKSDKWGPKPTTKEQGETQRFSFEKWRVLREEITQGSFSGKVTFAKLKLISRIIEKTQRCYKGDASQLTDLCRAAIGFESLEDLANCLGRNSEKSQYIVTLQHKCDRALTRELVPRTDALRCPHPSRPHQKPFGPKLRPRRHSRVPRCAREFQSHQEPFGVPFGGRLAQAWPQGACLRDTAGAD
jgi:hypothetical protein